MATQFVNDYKTKAQLAKSLRNQASAYGSIDLPYTTSTQGFGAAPPMVQANWAAPLAKLAGAYLGSKKQEEADWAQEEAQDLRRQALEGILGGGEFGVGQAVQLQDLGVDMGSMGQYLPKEQEASAPKMPSYENLVKVGVPSLLAFKASSGAELTTEEHDKVTSAITAFSNKGGSGAAPKMPSYENLVKAGVPSSLAFKASTGAELTPEEHDQITSSITSFSNKGGGSGAAAGAILQAIQSGKVHPKFAMAISAGQEITPELLQLQMGYMESLKEGEGSSDPKNPNALLVQKQQELLEAIKRGDQKEVKRLQGVLDVLARSKTPGAFDPEPEPVQTFNGKAVKQLIELESPQAKISQKYRDNAAAAAIQADRTANMLEIVKRPETFGKANKFAAVLKDYATSSPGAMGAVADAVAQAIQDPTAPIINVNTMDQVLKNMAQLGGSDSNEELRQIKNQYVNVNMTPETASALLQELGHWAELAQVANTIEDLAYRSGQPVPGGSSHQYAKDIMSGKVEPPAGLNVPKSKFTTGMQDIISKERAASPTTKPSATFDELWGNL